MKYEMIALSV